jgi:hypothetical protein
MQESVSHIINKIEQKPKHLNPGVKPIIACLEEMDELDLGRAYAGRDFLKDSYRTAHDVDYRGEPRYLQLKNFLHNDMRSYVISTIDSQDKYSEGYQDCTGLVVSGVTPDGQKISFITHQDPKDFLHIEGVKESFIHDLRIRFAEMKQRCGDDSGNIDVVMIGGKYAPTISVRDYGEVNFKKDYVDSIKLLTLETKNALGFEPIIINGPKVEGASDNIYYNNENKRLYYVRPKIHPDVWNVTQGDMENA